MRSARPTTVACLPLENSASEPSAISTGPVRQPASATAKKFISERLAWCRTGEGMSSHRVVTTKRARSCVTPGLCNMLVLSRLEGSIDSSAQKHNRAFGGRGMKFCPMVLPTKIQQGIDPATSLHPYLLSRLILGSQGRDQRKTGFLQRLRRAHVAHVVIEVAPKTQDRRIV